MSLRISHSDDSENFSRLELSNGQAFDVKPGNVFEIPDPEAIACLIPQGKDLLLTTRHGDAFLLKNFLLIQCAQIELPRLPPITSADFEPSVDCGASAEAIEFRRLPADESSSLYPHNFPILSAIDALSLTSHLFDDLPICPDGGQRPDLRQRFETVQVSLLRRSNDPEKGAMSETDDPTAAQFEALGSDGATEALAADRRAEPTKSEIPEPAAPLDGAAAPEDASIRFDRTTFEQAFCDIEKDDTLDSVRIETLPATGQLLIGERLLELGEVVTVDRLASIVFRPGQESHVHADFRCAGFDGSSWSARAAVISIDIADINGSQISTFSIGASTPDGGSAFSLSLPADAFARIETSQSFAFLAALPSWLSLDSRTGAFSGVSSYLHIGDHCIDVTATDESGASFTSSFCLSIGNLSEQPTLLSIVDVPVGEDGSFAIETDVNATPQDTASSSDSTFSATLFDGSDLPEWMRFDGSAACIRGTLPPGSDTERVVVRIEATNETEDSAVRLFILRPDIRAEPPKGADAPSDASPIEDAGFAFSIADSFSEAELGDSPTFTATLPDGTELPEWLQFDGAKGLFTGAPTDADLGMLPVKVIANHGSKAAEEMFAIMVLPSPNGPRAQGISNKKPQRKKPFELDVANSFAAIARQVGLNYSATLLNGSGLPDWLAFDEASGLFSGFPTDDDIGSLSVLVLAANGRESANEIFSIEVENTDDGPVATFIPEELIEEERRQFLFDAANAFQFEGDTEKLSFAANLEDGSELPSWLSIDRFSGEVAAKPGQTPAGITTILVQASDSQNSACRTFELTVEVADGSPIFSFGVVSSTEQECPPSDLEDPDTEDSTPLLESAAAPADIDVDHEQSEETPNRLLEVAAPIVEERPPLCLDIRGRFPEFDPSKTLQFEATLSDGAPLPGWLSFDENEGRFSGFPTDAELAELSLLITATDGDAIAQIAASISYDGIASRYSCVEAEEMGFAPFAPAMDGRNEQRAEQLHADLARRA